MIITLKSGMIVKAVNLTKQNVKDVNEIAEAFGYDEDYVLEQIVQEGVTKWIDQINTACASNIDYNNVEIPDIPDYRLPPWERD